MATSNTAPDSLRSTGMAPMARAMGAVHLPWRNSRAMSTRT